MNPTYDFKGQVALVTGASSGMGLAPASGLLKSLPSGMRQDQAVPDGDVASTVHPHVPDLHLQMKTSSGPTADPSGGHGPSHSACMVQTMPSSAHVPDGSASLVRAPGSPTPAHMSLFG